ncbi:tetratricopeptide repeat protein [Patescibacteria group bacterium]
MTILNTYLYSSEVIRLTMNSNLAHKAIANAMAGRWEQALKYNLRILNDLPEDVDALNRSARAYAELGDIPNAKKSARKVLSIDPFNNIAQKSLGRWKNLKKGDVICAGTTDANVFIEEPGKTKTIKLIHTGDKRVLCVLEAGMKVVMQTNAHRVSICTIEGKYIGRFPDDISAHIKNLVQIGNDYMVCVKSIEEKSVHVFIRETKRSDKIKQVPSFSAEGVEFVKIAV